MNELPTLPEHNPASPPAAQPPVQHDAVPGGPTPPGGGVADYMQRPVTVALIVLALLLGAHAWSTHNRIKNLRQDMARSLQKGEAVNNETAALARALQEQTGQLQAKVNVLENRQIEAQSQQLALEQLYQDMSKNRDEWALAEIEQVLSTASQQLQLAANVSGALIALQNADRSLSRSDKPQFISIRRALARDIEKLRGLPTLDLTGIALRLDHAIGQVDQLPLLSDEKPAQPPAPVRRTRVKPAAAPSAPAALGTRLQETWHDWSGEMWSEVRQLIRVRRVDTPEALMLSPEESYFVRENLKLRLLNARMALLSRNESAFRSDLTAAQVALAKYFDTRARSTQSAQAVLRQVQSNNLAIEMPTLADSLTAVRNYKAKP